MDWTRFLILGTLGLVLVWIGVKGSQSEVWDSLFGGGEAEGVGGVGPNVAAPSANTTSVLSGSPLGSAPLTGQVGIAS